MPLATRRIFVLILICAFISGFAQQSARIDELQKKLQHTSDGKARVGVLNELAEQYLRIKPAEARKYALQAFELAQKIDLPKGKVNAANNVGNTYYLEGDYNSSLEYYLKGLKVVEELGDKKGIANSLMGIGNIYSAQNNNKLALEYQLKSLRIREELNDKDGIAGCYNNIGIVYMTTHEYDKALDYQERALQLKEELGDKKSMSSSLANIGAIYYELGNYTSAMEYQQKAFVIRKELNNKKGIAMSYVDMGNICEKQGKYEDALQSQLSAVKAAKEVGYKVALKSAYLGLSSVYEKLNDAKNALEYYKLFTATKDSIFNTENSAKLIEMQTRFDTERKEKEIGLLTKGQEIHVLQAKQQQFELDKQRMEAEQRKREISMKENELQGEKLKSDAKSRELRVQAAEVENQRIIRYVVTAGLFVVLIVAVLLVVAFRQKHKANKILEVKNHEIEEAYQIIEVNRDLIAEKNKSITDSINYASRIQKAMLPSGEEISRSLREHFIFYRPKDIVSGDFYFYAEQKGKSIIAAVDCTGHGVPGAFMSMIGNDILNQIIMENGVTQPAEILTNLNKGVKKALRQETQNVETKDGMDIAICAIDVKTRKVEYAGAMRPLYYGKGDLKKLAADKASIGGTTEENYRFTNHELTLERGEMLYMFSDGYVDQFGGEKGKKFLVKNFKSLLDEISSEAITVQSQRVEETFLSWAGKREQVDDILVIGVKL